MNQHNQHPSGRLQRTLILLASILSPCWLDASELKFDFGSTEPLPGATQVTPTTIYDQKRGFGYLEGSAPASGKPALFAVNVPEGNYDVTLRFGDPKSATSTTIKSEARRLVLHNVETAPGKFETRSFTVNVRTPEISTGGAARLNAREKGPPMHRNWDEHLSFEFNGSQPGVASMEIKPAPGASTVFIAGDSTVTDQKNEPFAGWGQMLPRFFQQGVAISNHAESGLALHSFERQDRLKKLLSMMKKGDYLFIQFGHNDQKDKREGAGPFTTYKEKLKMFVSAVREKGGKPVIVTPMERLRMDDAGNVTATLSDYAEAVRQVAAEVNVPVIDLNAMSLDLYKALGPESATKAFAFYPANTFPGQNKELKDRTHHNAFGAYELARCVVEGIKEKVPELAKHLRQDLGAFDPAKPDSPEAVNIPLSPMKDAIETPAGS